jgi:ATP-dependent DNA ligase
MRIDSTLFASDAFLLAKRYQGCGVDITGASDEMMLAKLEATGKYVAEPKLDGIWGACFVLPHINVFVSRNQKRKSYGLETYQRPCLKPGLILIGEPAMGTQFSVERRAMLGHDIMDVHDILAEDYEDLSGLGDDDRRKRLEEWHASLDGPTAARFQIVPRFTKDFVAEYHNQHEGLVLKEKGNRPYKGDKRKVKWWVKAKKAFEADMVVMDFRLSSADTKTSEPMVESVLFGQYVNGKLKGLVWVGSMPRRWQTEFAQNFSRYHGKVGVLGHYTQFKSGSLRHPYFIRLRDDKEPHECVFK